MTMATELVSARIPKTLLKDIKAIVEQDGFSSVPDFLRHAARKEIKIRKAHIELQALCGSAKGKISLASKAELEAHIRKIYFD